MIAFDSERGRLLVATEAPLDLGDRLALWSEGRRVAALQSDSLSLLHHGPRNLLASAPTPGGRGRWVTMHPSGAMAAVPSDLAVEWTVPGDCTFYITDAEDRRLEPVTALYAPSPSQPMIPVEPGSVLHFATYAAVHRCYGHVELAFFGMDQVPLPPEDDRGANRGILDARKFGGVELSAYARCQVTATVPRQAAYAQVRIVKGPRHGAESSYMFFLRPYLGVIPPPYLIPSDNRPMAFREGGAIDYIYAITVPLALFDGEPHDLAIGDVGGSVVRVLGDGPIVFPAITRVSVEVCADEVVQGVITAEQGVPCILPLALRTQQGDLVCQSAARWDGADYVFVMRTLALPLLPDRVMCLQDRYGFELGRFAFPPAWPL